MPVISNRSEVPIETVPSTDIAVPAEVFTSKPDADVNEAIG